MLITVGADIVASDTLGGIAKCSQQIRLTSRNNADYRRNLAKEVTDQGIGKGALVVSKTVRWSNKQGTRAWMHYATITKTDFRGLAPLTNWAVSKRACLLW